MRSQATTAVFSVSALLLGGFCAPCVARDWDQDSFQLRSWGVAEGMPGSHVSAVAQDADGFLWMATMAGLVRFDGVEFRVYNESHGGLPTARFNALDVGPSGRLWIGSEQGQLIVRESGEFRVVAQPHFPGIPIGSIAEAGDGSVWFTQGSSSSGVDHVTLWQWTDSEPVLRDDIQAQLVAYPMSHEFMTVDKPGGPLTLEGRFPEVIISRDANNAVWARAWAGSSLRVHDGVDDPFGAGDVRAMMLGSAEIMARASGLGVDLMSLESGSRVATLALEPAHLRAIWLRDRRSLVWTNTTQALQVFGPDSSTTLASWPLDSQVLDLDEDREGNIWVATRTMGVLRISPNPVRQLTSEQGVPLPSKLRPEPDGSAVMSVQVLQSEAGMQIERANYRIAVRSVLPRLEVPYWNRTDRNGIRWSFGAGDLRGVRRDGTELFLNRYCDDVHMDPKHDILWASDLSTLFRIRLVDDLPLEVDGEWTLSVRSEPYFDSAGSLWIGAADGLHHIDGEQHRVFTLTDGLPANEVRALYPDPRGGLWIGTYGGGIAYFDGSHFQVVDQRHGLVENAVSSIIADHLGALWMGGNRGIQRVLLNDLHALLDGTSSSVPSMLFGHEHGLDNAEAVGPFSGVAVGDRLYFSTFGGLAVIDPALVAEREQLPVQVHLLDATRDDVLNGDMKLELPTARRDVSVGFTALHLSAPETLRFRYRLDGRDDQWLDAGSERSLSYVNLGPGAYRLHLQARHSGLPWVDAPSTMTIDVLPQWWETRAALILTVLAAIALLAAMWWLGQRRMRRRAQALQVLVEQRTSDLLIERDQVARQASRLQELAEGRARFMSGISHELRTPLSLILAPLTDIGEGMHGEVSAELQEEIRRIRRNAQRLSRLVQRLLEVARIESSGQTLHCGEADLGAVIVELVEQLQPLADQRGSTLSCTVPGQPVLLWFDPLLMESVLVNLMVNGLRHTPAGSTVRIELQPMADEDSSAVCVEVHDNGPGIPPEARPHLFERFFRVRGEQASEEGFGLGLPLVREVVERHGGQVDVISSSAGTCFTLQFKPGREHLADADIADSTLLPRDEASMISAVGSALDAAAREGHDIQRDAVADDRKLLLIVDDNAELRRLLRSYLQSSFRLREADSGEGGLQCVAQELPDLIISDVMMPGMDGFAFCRALRASPETDFIPLLMLTAKAGLDHRIEGLETGADAYVAKPFDRRELMATLHGLLDSRQRLRRHYQQLPDSDPSDPAVYPVTPLAPDWPTSRFADRLADVLQAHLADEGFDVEAMAEAMSQDRSTLYRTVKSEFGVTPSALLRETRLLRAQSLLQRGEGNVGEVAYAVGFKTVAHFSTSFRQRFGQPPSQVASPD